MSVGCFLATTSIILNKSLLFVLPICKLPFTYLMKLIQFPSTLYELKFRFVEFHIMKYSFPCKTKPTNPFIEKPNSTVLFLTLLSSLPSMVSMSDLLMLVKRLSCLKSCEMWLAVISICQIPWGNNFLICFPGCDEDATNAFTYCEAREVRCL